MNVPWVYTELFLWDGTPAHKNTPPPKKKKKKKKMEMPQHGNTFPTT